MAASVELRVVEILCSRLCHDLISPVSAINNGVELIEEMGEEVREEALELIGFSGEQLARRLQALRLAFGAALSSGNVGFPQVREAALGLFKEAKVKLDWPVGLLSGSEEVAGLAKSLINIVLMMDEALSRGGLISVKEGDGAFVEIHASGENARLDGEVKRALLGDLTEAELTPRTVASYLLARYMRDNSLQLGVQEMPGHLICRIEPISSP
jgi:histidine phosphotransferase ChpT